MKTIFAIACFVLLVGAEMLNRAVKKIDEIHERKFGRDS